VNDKEVFDLKGAAAYLGIRPVQLRTMAKAGKISYARVTRLHWRFTRRDLDSFVERQTHRARTVFGPETAAKS
jgi:excisionase family DNA binding protein